MAEAATTAATSASAGATTTAQTVTDTAAAAEAFLATLSEEQREQLLYDYDDETKTTSWSNFPVTFVEGAGLNLGQYYIAFFGDPSDTDAWEVQFGGHHLGINATLDGAGNTITFAPTHLGVQPAAYTNEDGEEVQPFDGIYTDAFAFYNSLTDEQLATLTSGEVSMCAPGDTCDFATGSGLRGSDLTEEQRHLLLDVIANWAGLADEETTATALADIEATIDDTYLSWSGATEHDMSTGDGISFSISGPDVYIAFQAQQGSAGADVDGVTASGWGHVHTIYRDPSNDYAGSATQQASTGMGGPAGGPGDGGTP